MVRRIINWFSEWFRQWDNYWNGLCPKHGTAYSYSGYEERRYCPDCWLESKGKQDA